jgi:phospholipase C
MKPSLRALLGLCAALPLPALLAACATEADDANSDESHLEARPFQNEAAAAQARGQCRFGRGALPSQTLGAEVPVGTDMPIQTIVVLMQENRSFDSYFGHLNKFAGRNDIESAPDTASNPERVNTPGSPQHPYQHAPMLCSADTNHEWWGAHLEYNNGQNDGFWQANNGFLEADQARGFDHFTAQALANGDRAMWWYDERDIPFYYTLAATFAIGDHYHSSVLGPTYVNRDYLYAATSMGVTTNHKMPLDGLGVDRDMLIFDMLENRGISFGIYVDTFPRIPRVGASIGSGFLNRWHDDHIHGTSTFRDLAKKGQLPQVVFVDGNITEDIDGNDEHPPGDIQIGQKFMSDTIHTLFASPQWAQMAIFLTYDENGGIYDHVPPPPACKPDGLEPVLEEKADKPFPGAFDRLGFRVPFTVVSPWVKPRFVSHKTYDHTSITRFIEARFNLPALTARDANADALIDFFDFRRPPAFLVPPALPEPTIDPSRLGDCKRMLLPPNQDHGGGG